MPNRRRGSENLHRPEFAEKGARLVENGRKERLQTREKDDEREKGGVGAVREMRSGTETLLLKEIAERIEKGKERRSRIVQELFKLYDRVRELEGKLEEEITELLKRIDEDDFIVEFYGVTLENNGLEWWTKRGKEIYVRADGSIEVRDRRGKPVLKV